MGWLHQSGLADVITTVTVPQALTQNRSSHLAILLIIRSHKILSSHLAILLQRRLSNCPTCLTCLQSDSVGFQPREENLRIGFALLHFAPLHVELRYQYYYPHVAIDKI